MSNGSQPLNRNLVFLFVCMVILVGALFMGEKWYPGDGQFFQVFAGILTSVATVFVGAARHVLGMTAEDEKNPDDPPDTR